MKQDYKDNIPKKVENLYLSLEERIMQDIVRRIKQEGKVTSTADWQINRMTALGKSSEDIENMIKETLGATYPEMFELYDKVIDWEYVRNKDIYEQINANYIPYEENKQMQQFVEALSRQTKGEFENITKSMGFYLDYGGGKKVMTPLSEVYQGYLDNAIMDIASGSFDYNTVLRRTVTQLTNSGLRTIEFASGRNYRVNVAARMAIMTGMSQLTGKISDMNAEKLVTDYFEVAWHSGARPTHSVWQGKVWSRKELETVCGMGTAEGLLGVNCYHEYYPFIPGISERNWTDEWLEEQNRKENTPKEWFGKEYTTYEAKQKQRQMETAMRAQREKVKLLREGGADPDEVMLARAKYQAQLDEYARFSKKMGLKQERERIYLDGSGRVALNKMKYYRDMSNEGKYIATPSDFGIIKLKRFNTKDDPMREVTGPAEKSNPKEIARMEKELIEAGVEIIRREKGMAYSPALTPGKAGQFHIEKDASYSAWCHEFKHFSDDRDDGYLGYRVFQDSEKCKQRERDAYQIEIELAEKANRPDIVARLKELRDKEVSKYE